MRAEPASLVRIGARVAQELSKLAILAATSGMGCKHGNGAKGQPGVQVVGAAGEDHEHARPRCRRHPRRHACSSSWRACCRLRDPDTSGISAWPASTDDVIERLPVEHGADPALGHLAPPGRRPRCSAALAIGPLRRTPGAARSSALHRRRSHLYDPSK